MNDLKLKWLFRCLHWVERKTITSSNGVYIRRRRVHRLVPLAKVAWRTGGGLV